MTTLAEPDFAQQTTSPAFRQHLRKLNRKLAKLKTTAGRLQTAVLARRYATAFAAGQLLCRIARDIWELLWLDYDLIPERLSDKLLAQFIDSLEAGREALSQIPPSGQDRDTLLWRYRRSCRARVDFAVTLRKFGVTAAESLIDNYFENLCLSHDEID